jgi:hypothetical protein
MLGFLFLSVLLLPVGVILSYLLLPAYIAYRPKDFTVGRNTMYNLALWAVGLLPILSVMTSFAMTQLFPQTAGSGEPGLNFGYDMVPIAIGAILLFGSHVMIWLLRFAGQRV